MKPNQNSVTIEELQNLVPVIAAMMKRPSIWKSLDVDYYPPRVHRLWSTVGDYRVHLHSIFKPKGNNEMCLFHKHRWPAVFWQLAGTYEMGVSYSEKELSPEEALKLPILTKSYIVPGSYYEMTQTDCLHYVKPITDVSHSIMLTKDLYPEERKESLDRTLEPLTENQVIRMLQFFKGLNEFDY